jgi:superfamily II DNA/RNA helicase
MLNMGFVDDVETILGAASKNADGSASAAAGPGTNASGEKLQTLLFSATMPSWVKDITRRFLMKEHKIVDLVGDDKLKVSGSVCTRSVSWRPRHHACACWCLSLGEARFTCWWAPGQRTPTYCMQLMSQCLQQPGFGPLFDCGFLLSLLLRGTQAAATVRHLMLPAHWTQRTSLVTDLVACYGCGGRSIIFTETKNDANELAASLSEIMGAR